MSRKANTAVKTPPRLRLTDCGAYYAGIVAGEDYEQALDNLRAELGEEPQPVRAGEQVPPGFKADAFHCAWSGVLASQTWIQLQSPVVL